MNPEDRVRQMLDSARGEEDVTGAEWDSFSGAARRSVRMQRIVTAGIGIALAASVAVGGSAILGGDNKDLAPVSPDSPSPETRPTEQHTDGPSPLVETEVWLVDPETATLSWGTRTVPGGTEPLSSVLEELLSGLIGPELEMGIETEIPAGTELLDTEVLGEEAHITLSSEFDDPGTGSPGSMRLREAQVVFTATQIEGIESVRLFVEQESFLGQTKPTSRDDYDDVSPPIVVETPNVGEKVSSPMTVSGSANVFEGTVMVELHVPGPRGVNITSFTTASCGSGCRGDFTEKVRFDDLEIDEATEARLNVFEESAEDGSRLHEVSLPVTLMPSE